MAKRDKLNEKIDAFLKDYRKSDGGWAEIVDEDIHLLHKVINELIKLKCDPDPDSDYVIQFQLINRRTHRPSHAFPIPYDFKSDHDATDEEQQEIDERVGEVLLTNLEMALNDFSRHTAKLKCKRFRRKQKK